MFVKATNGSVVQYPYTIGDLRRDNPNTSFPKNVSEKTMADYGVFPVEYDAAPDYNPLTHRIEHSSTPSLVDGEWKLTKTVVVLTPEQVADASAAKAKEARKKRNELIAATDYFALTDVCPETQSHRRTKESTRSSLESLGWKLSLMSGGVKRSSGLSASKPS